MSITWHEFRHQCTLDKDGLRSEYATIRYLCIQPKTRVSIVLYTTPTTQTPTVGCAILGDGNGQRACTKNDDPGNHFEQIKRRMFDVLSQSVKHSQCYWKRLDFPWAMPMILVMFGLWTTSTSNRFSPSTQCAIRSSRTKCEHGCGLGILLAIHGSPI